MASDQLTELFLQKKRKLPPSGDGAVRRDAWIAAVNDLYRVVEDKYLAGSRGDVEVVHPDKVVTEAFIGEYHIPEMVLRVGDEQVVFSPQGINVAGAKGRIDLAGDCGDATILWQGEDHWSIIAARTPTLKMVPLTADALAEVLKGIMRP
ncbi:MAG: hypothetical protein ACR2FY_10970 [Pirellulaceae bacterium]